MSDSVPTRSEDVAPDPPGLRDAFGHVLRYGVVLSGLFLIVGFGLAAARGASGLAGTTGTLPLHNLLGALGAGAPWAYLFVGVAVLAATPIVRVALALVAFAGVRDRSYVVITGFVLAVLLASLAIGVVA